MNKGSLSDGFVSNVISDSIQKGLLVEDTLMKINEKSGFGFESKEELKNYFFTRQTIKTFNHLKAVSLLMSNNLFDETIIISRSVIEKYFCVRYATVIEDDFIERFCKYHQYHEDSLVNLYEEVKGEAVPDEFKERIEQIHREGDAVKGVFEEKGWEKHNKWKKNWREMCRCIDDAVEGRSDGKIGTALELYKYAYSIFSDFTHGAPTEWNYKMTPDRKQMFLRYIFNTALIATRVFQIVGKEYGIIIQ